MNADDSHARRFAVALSFPGEHRRFVRSVARRLADELDRDRVFFDEWYAAELHGSDADLKLRRIYREESELIVPFFSEHYTKMWCGIEWSAIRTVLAERKRDNAVVPVHIDGTRIEGWETIDLGIRKGHKTGRQIAQAILEIYRLRRPPIESGEIAGRIVPYETIHSGVQPPPHRRLLRELERSLATGELQDSELGPHVLAALREEANLELIEPFDTKWITVGVRTADYYFRLIRQSAGIRDWQRDFPQTATPILVGVAHTLMRSPDAQAVVIRLCEIVAQRLRLILVWPDDADEVNDLKNLIYRECLESREAESDSVLVALRGLKVIGPA